MQRGELRPRLLLNTNSKLRTSLSIVPQMTFTGFELPLRTLFQNVCVFWSYHENLNEDRPILFAAKITAAYTFCTIFTARCTNFGKSS